MSRRSPWIAVVLAAVALLGVSQASDADWSRLARSAWRAITAGTEPARPTRRATPPPGTPIAGIPRIIDGDTLDLDGIRVRMQGIDAFEHDQQCSRRGGGGRFACGAAARAQLAELVGDRSVTCTPDGSLTHGRTVAHCTVPGRGGAIDLNAEMVRSGLAFDCPRYSKGRYADEEAAAKSADAGAWGGRFTYPWSHRDRAGACGR